MRKWLVLVSPTIVEVVFPCNSSPMLESLPCNSPMEMDLHGGEGKDAIEKEKRLLGDSEAIDFATKIETYDNGPILGKKRRVDGLNSSKKGYKMNKKTGKQEK